MAILGKGYLARSISSIIFTFMILLLSYLIYVHPVFLIGYLIFDFRTDPFHLIILSLIIACITFIYLRTHLSNSLIRIFIYNGMGLGFIGFWVSNLGLIISIFRKIIGLKLVCASLFLFFLLSLHGLSQGRLIKLKDLKFESAKVNETKTFYL